MTVKKITYWEQLTPAEKRTHTQTVTNEHDEQAERIKESLKEYYANQELLSLQEFEDMFEDRDPFEFL